MKSSASKKYLIFTILLVILVTQSVHILFNAYTSTLGYDLSKVISYLSLYPDFTDYVRKLGFSLGVASQAFGLGYITEPTPRLFRLGSYIFFIATFLSVLYQLRIKISDDNLSRSLVLMICAAFSMIFFTSNVLKYLGSYGMLVYCQSFLFGSLLLYFSKKHLWNDIFLSTKLRVGWFLFFIGATFLDVRFSFYLGIVFVIALFLDIKNITKIREHILFGSILAAFLLIPIGYQFIMIKGGFVNYKPNHVLPLLYSGDYKLYDVLRFIFENTSRYLRTIVGANSSYQLVFLFFLAIGIFSEFRFKEGCGIVIFLILSLLILIISSLFYIYPFGSIRYSTVLFPFILYLYFSGIVFLALIVFKRIQNSILKIIITIVAIVLLQSLALKENISSIAHSEEKYFQQEKLLNVLREYTNDEVWCDYATQKIALSYSINCRIVATWNYQKGEREDDSFYARLDSEFSSVNSGIVFFLFMPFETAFYDPVRGILNNHSLVVVDKLEGSNYLYKIEKKSNSNYVL